MSKDKKDYNIIIDGIAFWGEHQNNKGGLRIFWSAENIGFGTTDLVQNHDGTLYIDKEYMNDEFIEEVLKSLLEASNNNEVLRDPEEL